MTRGDEVSELLKRLLRVGRWPTKRILLVEDDAIVRVPVFALLAEEGYDVEVAATELEALRAARARPPDLAIEDVNLARGGSGIALCEGLRATLRLERVPFLILTADAKRETDMRRVAAGANDYYLKAEFSLDALLARVRMWIGGSCPDEEPRPSDTRW